MRALLFVSVLAAAPVLAQGIEGKVTGITDGDTLTVLSQGRQLRVRLADIDAPELRQSFGAQAKQSLSDICHGRQATVKMDRGRSTARVSCEGVDANAEQVRKGMAWVYKRDARTTSPLYFLEDEAQRSKAGLWSEASPLEPWRWRASQARKR